MKSGSPLTVILMAAALVADGAVAYRHFVNKPSQGPTAKTGHKLPTREAVCTIPAASTETAGPLHHFENIMNRFYEPDAVRIDRPL
jgi:hypothetical protein